MKNAGWSRVPAGAEMMGADGEVYFVPDGAQPTFRVPGPRAVPGAGGLSADIRIRRGIQAGMAYLPQMGNLNC
jgi:hypothetical protein